MAVKNKKGRRIVKVLLIIVAVYMLMILWQLIGDIYSRLVNTHEIEVSEEWNGESYQTSIEWNLIVVNRWNPIPENYSVELTVLSNGQKVDSRIYPHLQEILDDKIQAYINEGYSQWRAERTAKEWVALPGTSEHQLGIAVDINADKSKCTNDDVYAWLAENAYKYGFVLRYPLGKQEITGTSYEPWHYRYVGAEVAQKIYEQGICLEEYFE